MLRVFDANSHLSPSLLAHKHTNTHNYVQMHAPHSHTGTPPSELVIALALDATLTAAAHANMIAAANKSIYVLKHGDGKNAGILPVGMNVVIREVYMKECSESNDLAPMRALINALSHETPGASSKDCPCLESSKVFSALNTSGYVDGNGNIVLEGVPQPLYLTDRDGRKRGAVYGGDSCMSHDQQLPPSCADATGIPLANAPAWCLMSWCFVDTASCDRTNTQSAYFPAAKLMYSYDTCGSEDLYGSTVSTWNPIPNEKRRQARLQAMSTARTSRLDASVAASGSVAFEPGSNDRESLGFVYEIVNLRKSSPNSSTTRAVVGRMERGKVAFTAQVIWPGNTTARPADRSSSTVPPTIVINLVGKGDNQTDLILKLAVAQQAADEINANLELLPLSRLVISSTKDLSSDYTPAELESAVLGRLNFSTPAAPVVALVTTTSSLSKNALASKKFTLPVIGIFATSPSLSNAADYPFFSRVIPSDESMSLALIKLMRQLGWTRFFFLYKCSSNWGKANEAMLASNAAKWEMKMESACLSSSSAAATNTTADVALQKAAEGLYTIIIPFFSAKLLLAFLRRGVDKKLLDRKRGHQFVFGTSTTTEREKKNIEATAVVPLVHWNWCP